MSKEQDYLRIDELRNVINRLNTEYYVYDNPSLPDIEYDKLRRELVKLEEQYPEKYSPNSPTLKVGGEVLDKFEKEKHLYPMLSLQDAFEEEEIEQFERLNEKELNQSNLEFACEPKFDGLAMCLIYENGILTKGITRGDGIQGENVTNNVRTIKNIPLDITQNCLDKGIPVPTLLEVRGEVVMLRKDFEALNEKQRE